MQQGSVYVKLSQNRYFTVDTFDNHGQSRRNNEGSTFKDKNTTLYVEYGLLNNLTLFGSLPYKNLTSHYRFLEDGIKKGRRTTYHGFGDIELGLKYNIINKPIVLSVHFLTKLAWLYDGDEELVPGNNQNDYELKLLLGKSLWPFPGYCGLELGYRWRTNDPSDEYRYLLEFGVNITDKLFCRIKLDGIKSVKNGRLPGAPEPYTDMYVDYETGQLVKRTRRASGSSSFSNPSLGLEYDMAKLELTVGYQYTKKWSCEFTYTNYPYGENIAAGDQYSLALVYYFSSK